MTKWSCEVLKPPEADVGDMCKPVTLKSDQPYFIPADKLSEGEFNFTLEIWTDLYREMTCKQCKMAKLHQFRYQTVVVTNKANLLILCENNCWNKVYINDELILKVSYIDNTHEVQYNWTCKKVENEEYISFTQLDGYASYIFIIPQDTLEASTRYLVTVSANIDGEKLSASYDFETDDFSYKGKCSVDPDSGISGLTSFDISCPISEIEPLAFEFYDTTEEVSGNCNTTGRMLGVSYDGEMRSVLLTRGVLQVHIISRFNCVSQKYNVNLREDRKQLDDLLFRIVHSPSYFENMPLSLFIQYISSLPDIATNSTNAKAILDIALKRFLPNKLIDEMEVKMFCNTLYNILHRIGQGNMDFNTVTDSREMISVMVKKLREKVFYSLKLTNEKEAKEIAATILNTLELTLTAQNEKEFDETNKYIALEPFLDLTQNSDLLLQTMNNIKTVLSFMQRPGSPPTTVSSKNNTFVVRLIEEDTKYNFSLPKMLQKYSDLPVTFSPVLIQRLRNSLKPNQSLSLCLATVDKNIFKGFDGDIASNIIILSLNKRSKNDELHELKEVTSTIDMEMYLNSTLPEVKEVGQTIPLDPTLEEDILDLHVRVHRFDPARGSKLYVTFLYPPTNVTLRVLIMEGYRPTYKLMVTQSSLVTQQSPLYSPNYTRTIDNTFYYMGVLPGPGLQMNRSFTYSFTLKSTTCVSWSRVTWSSSGCTVGQNTSGQRIHCQCNHLSVFGALFPYLPNEIDPFADAKLFLTVWDNPLVLSIMLVILFLYIILSVISYRMDKRDRFRGAITVLEDNFPNDGNPYVLAVYTGSHFFAGSTANVAVQIIGAMGNSRAHILKSKHYRVLSRQSDDWFLILCPKPLGIIQYLHIWHDNTGMSPDWYCDRVHVFDINNSLECLFIVEQWIVMDATNFPEALLVPAGSHDILKINRVLNDNISEGFKEQKFITGIFTQHPRNIVKRVVRVNIFVCCLLISLLFSIMFYIDLDEKTPDNYTYNVQKRDLYISMFTLAAVIVVKYVITLLFHKSYKLVLLKNRSVLYLRESEFLEDYVDSKNQENFAKNLITEEEEKTKPEKNKSLRKRFVQALKNIMTTTKLAPAVLPHGTPGIKVQRVWLTVSWATCVIIIIFCMYFITLYGLKMGLVKSKKWITSVLITEVNGKFVISPLTVIGLAVMLTATFGFVNVSASYRANESEIRMSVSEMQNKTYANLVKQREHPMYSPMKVEEREKIRRRSVRFNYLVQVLRFLLSLCYIIIVFTTVLKMRSLHFYRNDNVKRVITSTSSSINTFFSAYDIADISVYSETTFLKGIYKTKWYNNWPLFQNTSSLYEISDYSWRLLDPPYIRQQRVVVESCRSIAPPANHCVPPLVTENAMTSDTEDTDPYAPGWYAYASPSDWKDGENLWGYTYPTVHWLRTYYRLVGASGKVYNNGGYGSSLGTSIPKAVEKVTDILDNKWMDMFTKVVFFEVSLYNVNVRSVCDVTLIIEFLTTGVSLKAARITSVVDCDEIGLVHVAFTILTFLILLEIGYQINFHGLMSFFRDIRNIILLLLVIPSIFVLIAYFIRAYKCHYYDMWEAYYVKKSDYFNFDLLMSFHTNMIITLSILLLLSVWRSLMLLQSLNLFMIIHSLFKLSLIQVLFLSFLTSLGFFLFWLISLMKDSSSSSSVVNLVISSKYLPPSTNFVFDSVAFLIVKFCTMMLLSKLFTTIFVHCSKTAQLLNRKTPDLQSSRPAQRSNDRKKSVKKENIISEEDD